MRLAGPLHTCGASLDHLRLLEWHTLHHQPDLCRLMLWSPSATVLALTSPLTVGSLWILASFCLFRSAAATAASTPFRDWAPPPPPETNNPQRPKILVVGLGPAGCASASQLRKALGARVEIRCAEAGRSVGEKSFEIAA